MAANEDEQIEEGDIQSGGDDDGPEDTGDFSFETAEASIERIPSGPAKDDAIFNLLCKHPWVRKNNKDITVVHAGVEWKIKQWNLAVNPRGMSRFVIKRMKKARQSIPREYKMANDDMAYACSYDADCTVFSKLLRKYMTRGFTRFEFRTPAGVHTETVRGLNKFTGLTAADEDDDSEATDKKDLFFEDGTTYTASDALGVSVKSNGENGKGTLRNILGTWWVLAGSKNTCLACPLDADCRVVEKDIDETVPGPRILHLFHDFVVGVRNAGKFDTFSQLIESNKYIFMFEYNSHTHEHVLPINGEFIEAFAIRGLDGIAIHPRESFRIFSEYGLKSVEYYETPASQLQEVINTVRHRRDTEGVVIYFLLSDKVIGALKCKSDYYTLGRAVRQKFWRIPDDLKGGYTKGGKNPALLSLDDSAVERVCSGIAKRMKEMKHIPECDKMHKEWAAEGQGFVRWWAAQYRTKRTLEDKLEYLYQAKNKFGSLYFEFLATQAPSAGSAAART